MAKQTTQQDVILNFQVSQTDMLKELSESRKAIIETKEAQQELNKAYRAGEIAIDDYAEQTVLLEGQLKEEQTLYKNLTKAIDANNTSLDGQRKTLALLTAERNKLDKTTKEGIRRFNELNEQIKNLNSEISKHEQAGGDFRRNVGNYGNQAKEAAKSINIAGVSVGDLTGKLAAFANPATAAVAATTALVTLYAKSTKGAQDFAFAQTRLSFVIGSLGEGLGKLVGGGEGDGLFSRLLDLYLRAIRFVPVLLPFRKQIQEIIDQSNEAAKAQERLRDIEISLSMAQGFGKDDERRAELQRRIRDDDTQSIEARLAASQKIDDLLNASAIRTTSILKAQAQAVRETSKNYDNDRQAQLEVQNITSEIADKQEEITGKLTENVTARRAILALQREELSLYEQEIRNANAPSSSASLSGRPAGSDLVDSDRMAAEQKIDAEKYLNDALLKLSEDRNLQEVRNREKALEQIKALEEQGLAATASILDQAASISEQGSALQQSLSITSALIKTYEAANVALASAPPPFNFILMAATIATGLVNVGKIAGFESGGYTGSGRNNEPAGVVHRNEVVWNAADVAAVGGPSRANSMRPTARSRNSSGGGYQDGGIVTQGATRDTNSALVTANILKNAPPAVVSVKEITRIQSRIRAKETVSSS